MWMRRTNLGALEYLKYPQVAGKAEGAMRDLLPGLNSVGRLSLALHTWAKELNPVYLTWD